MNTNYVSNEYPYGSFPNHYTKNGQAELRKKWQENSFKPIDKKNDDHPNDKHDEHHHKNKLDFHKLLPLIKKMNNKTPLSQEDLMGMFMNLMGNENKDLVDVFSVIANTQTTKEKDIKSENIISSKPSIDSFRKVQ